MKKEDILKKIEILFFDKSFGEVTIQEIADKLGIKKASLYYYFDSKNQLIDDLINFSFNNYLNDLHQILKLDFNKFIKNFIYYPSKNKNLFSIINQNGYCESIFFKNSINDKQKQLFNLISDTFMIKYGYSKGKTFLLLSLLEDLGKKKCLFGDCLFDLEDIFTEIKLLFSI